MRNDLLLVLLLIASTTPVALAQNRAVTGTVTAAEDNAILPGVSVTVKGTSDGTTTGANGRYQLTIPRNATLVFSSIGFVTQETPVGAGSVVDVRLAVDVRVLGEVVVNALGLEQDNDKLGTAVATVKGNALVQSGESSVINGIAAKTPGVLIQRSSGDPGASANIQIRGQSTITGNLQPLIIVDGIPISNASIGDAGVVAGTGDVSNQTDGVVQQSRLNDINPNDIASMEVLKGASAAALWGTRAANGVIVITTRRGFDKKGRRGDKPSVALRLTYGVDQINKVPPLQTAYGQGLNGRWSVNPRSWGDKIADRTGGTDAYITDPATPGYTGYVTLPDGSLRYAIAPGTVANPHGGKRSREVFDHGKEVFSRGFTRDNSLTVSGGDEKSSYFVSLGNTYTKGIAVAGSDYDRTTIRINTDRKLAPNFRSAATFAYSRVNANRVQQGSNPSGLFLGGLRSAPDFSNQPYVGDYTGPDGIVTSNQQVSYRNPLGDPALGGPGFDNPFWTLNRVRNNSKVNRFIASLEFTYDVTPWLNLLNRTGLDTYTDRRKAYFPVGTANAPNGALTEETIAETQLNNDFIVRATKQFSRFGGTLLAGFNLNERRADQVGATVTGILNPLSPNQLPNSPSTARTPFNIASTIRTGALYAQADVEALDMFFLTLTGRAETASTFGPAQNTFFYPSSSLAWQFTKLPLFRGNNRLTFGKLRVAYGTVGVQPTPYQTRTYLVPASSSALIDTWGTTLDAANYGGGYFRSTIKGNPALRPERKTELETGVDLRGWGDRLRFSGTYYTNQTVDVILQVPTAATTGFLVQNDNAAKLRNQGIELQLDALVIKTPNFTWTLSPNWSRNVNKVLSLQGATNIFLNGFAGNSVNANAVEGYPMGSLFGSRTERDDTGKPVLDPAHPGFIQLATSSGVIGNPNPQWRGGLGNQFTFFKNLSVYVLIDHVHTFDIWNGTRGALYSYGTHRDVGYETIVPADQATTIRNWNGQTVAQFGTKQADGSYAFRGGLGDFGGGTVALDESWYRNIGGGFNGPLDQFIEHISTTRIREVTLSYSWASAGLRRATGLQSVDLLLTGRNLFLFTGYTGVDPETNLTGVSNGRGLDYFNNPSTKSLMVTLKINY
ncbi:SusC/RagA family TonB-linked outer membrane protein [Spirosoma arcticum]